MDLSKFSLEDLLLAAVKSEVESKAIYEKIARSVSNALLKERFEYLAEEEDKHRRFIEGIYRGKFPGKEVKLPETTPVPLPKMEFSSEEVPLSDILTRAMEAELAAHEFYKSLAERFSSEEDRETRRILQFFSSMEMGHYHILKLEREVVERFEEFEDYNPMVHIGA